MLLIDKLKGHIPDRVLAEIETAAPKYGITTNLRLAHFLAQCAHESGSFRAVSENLNYSASGLLKIFPGYFKTAQEAKLFANKPELIANRVYASRMGNGDTASGDGWRYRGRGYIQLTGKQNYTRFDATVEDNILENPDLVATKYPLSSAGFYFNNRQGLWAACDRGKSDAVITAVTKGVNGGTNGLADRIAHFRKYSQLLGI